MPSIVVSACASSSAVLNNSASSACLRSGGPTGTCGRSCLLGHPIRSQRSAKNTERKRRVIVHARRLYGGLKWLRDRSRALTFCSPRTHLPGLFGIQLLSLLVV